MGVSEMPNINSKISLELFQEVFHNVEPDVEIESYEEAQGSGRGDNYTAILYRIQLNGYHRCITDGKKIKWERSLICKRLPESMARREAFKSEKLFRYMKSVKLKERNEVEFYNTIMPELLNFQKTKTTHIFKAIPECYLARSDLLIMEDLRTRGFKMPDRLKGLTVDESISVIKEIAQFHALSLAYKFEKPKEFDKLTNLTTEGIFCPSNELWYKNYYDILTKNAIQMVSDVLPEDSKYLKALKQFAETSFFQSMIELVSTESPLSAICHGDCWANNFLYRYEIKENSVNVLETNLVDFQLIRYSSIALDIVNLIFCCTSKSMREKHLNYFLKLYTTEIYKWLNILCEKIPDFLNSEKKLEDLFAKELKTYGRFALGLAMDIIPISTCSSEDAPDIYIASHRADEIIEGPQLNFPPNDLCRQKMSEILIDLVDGGML